MLSNKEYKELIKSERKKEFDPPYDFIYDIFEELEYHLKNKDFFLNNASEIVNTIRNRAWKKYQKQEKKFMSRLLSELIDKEKINNMEPLEAVTFFVENYPSHIYDLNLSNTQSRRSRAGKEFETIIELLLIGANIPMDAQGNIGKKIFLDKGLGKLVDIVSPGVTEFTLNKRYAVLISAKTTLRERWQEVPEEMGRTGASEMFLATLDTTSNQVLDTLYESNITLTTTKDIKENCYNNNPRIFTFEDLLKTASFNINHWENYAYDKENLEYELSMIDVQLNKHKDHKFVYDYYLNRKEKISRLLVDLKK